MLQFTIQHGSSALQGVGGALDNAMDRQQQLANQKIRAQQVEAEILSQQAELTKQLDKVAQNEQEFQREQEERMRTSQVLSRVMRGEDFSSIPQEELERTMNGVPVSAQIPIMQTATKARENELRRQDELRRDGRLRSLQQKAKKGEISEDEFVDAALAEAEGDSSKTEALEKRVKEENLKRSKVKTQIRTIDGLRNSTTFLAGMSREQVAAMDEAYAMFEELAEGNVHNEEDFEAAMTKFREARSDQDLVQERDELKQAFEEQQYLLEQMQIAMAEYDPRQALQVPDHTGLPPGAPSGLIPFEQGGDRVPAPHEDSSFGRQQRVATIDDSPPSIRKLPHSQQRSIAKQLDQNLRDIIEEAGIEPGDLDDQLYAETMSQVAKEMFNVNLPASEVLAWRGSLNGRLPSEVQAINEGRPDFLVGSTPEAMAARRLRALARLQKGSTLAIAGKLGVSVKDLLAVADPGSSPNAATFEETPEERAMVEQDTQERVDSERRRKDRKLEIDGLRLRGF